MTGTARGIGAAVARAFTAKRGGGGTRRRAWRAVLATNLDGVLLGCQHAIRVMRDNPGQAAGTGSIINISSRSGLVRIPLAAACAASKAAVRNHTWLAARQRAEQRRTEISAGPPRGVGAGEAAPRLYSEPVFARTAL